MEHNVKIYSKGKLIEKKSESGTNLLKFLRENFIEVNASCGGHGTCGKCRVKVEGLAEIKSDKEKKLLGSKAMEKGYRLACFNSIRSDISIFLDSSKVEARIITEGRKRSLKNDPIVKKEFIVFDEPKIDNQKSDLERVSAICKKHKVTGAIEFLRTLRGALRINGFQATLGIMDKRLIFVESGDTTNNLYGIAVDIGTTTIVAYLYDLKTGERIDVISCLNPQRKFGADVISRIDYTMQSNEGMYQMNKLIIDCVNTSISQFCFRNGLIKSDIYAAVFVGNTTMLHFLMNLTAHGIAVAPFIPVTTDMHKYPANEIGIEINQFGYAVIFPAVSAYIGADTVAAILSSGMYARKKISLLVDIGTNGEIALGNKEWIYACSTAAGPAFEGANIRNGVGGITGAIDKVNLSEGVEYSTIGNEPAIGLCGSGLVDAVAEMLKTGIIDETGRIDDKSEQIKDVFKDRIINVDGLKSFLLVKGDGLNEDDIVITQKDVRELQNAKAAIAAGINVLIKHAGLKVDDIDTVYLAGGFGSYLNIDSALAIGLIPSQLRGRIEAIGNAAGAGAIEGLVSTKMLSKALEIKNRVRYIELSSRKDFVEEYTECMMFLIDQ